MRGGRVGGKGSEAHSENSELGTPVIQVLYSVLPKYALEFPNAVVLNAVICRRAQKNANQRKRAQTQVRKRAQTAQKSVESG